jgi:hypothetical protein
MSAPHHRPRISIPIEATTILTQGGNAAEPQRWLPICRRLLEDAGITGISDQSLMDVIATGNGSARNILDSVISVILNVQRKHTQQLAVV